MKPSAFLDPARRNVAIAAVLLGAAMVLGGGGSPHPSTEIALQLLAGLAAIAWLWTSRALRLPSDRLVWAVSAIVLLVPLVQLIPLPPSIWHELPGRQVQVSALELVGASNNWWPISMSPARTLASLLAIIPPILLFIMTASLDLRERRTVILTIAVIAILSAILGALQMAGGPEGPRLYNTSHNTVLTGFNANRNTTADILLVGFLALMTTFFSMNANSGSVRGGAGKLALAIYASAALLLLACILTASRAGIVMIVPTILCAMVIYNLKHPSTSKLLKATTKKVIAAIAGISVIALGIFLLLRDNMALQKVAARFYLTEESRPGFWVDTVHAIQQHWPIGSGMGTFVPRFIAAERLTEVDPSTPNRAHNDYLEIALEAGALGIAAVTLIAIIVLAMAVRAWKNPASSRSQILFGLSVLGITAAHSLVDYPLRSMGMACLVAVACGVLAAVPTGHRTRLDSAGQNSSSKKAGTQRTPSSA